MRFSQSLGTSGLAGAEGLEPSARGFGVDVRKRAGERGRSKVEPSSRTSSEKVVLVWCCELKFSIQRRKQEGSPQKVLTIISYLAKEVSPFLDDLCTAGLDDFHDVPQGALGDAGVVVAQIALASFGDPNFRGVSVGRTLAHVDVDRFQGSLSLAQKNTQ